jgi:hypothetical protein
MDDEDDDDDKDDDDLMDDDTATGMNANANSNAFDPSAQRLGGRGDQAGGESVAERTSGMSYSSG